MKTKKNYSEYFEHYYRFTDKKRKLLEALAEENGYEYVGSGMWESVLGTIFYMTQRGFLTYGQLPDSSEYKRNETQDLC